MEVARTIRRWTIGAAAAAAAMIATVATSAYVHRPTGPRILAVQDIPVRPRARPTPVASLAPEPPPSAYVVRSVLPIDGPMKIGESHWDESAAPPTGTLLITVDLAAQVLSVFRDGHEIGAAAILYGADAKPTPLGVYPITQKDADHHSNIYSGAPMPYMLRLTNDGVAIHASAHVSDGYMTHGCIGVPLDFARRLFGAAKLGDRVIVTRGETLGVGKPITAA